MLFVDKNGRRVLVFTLGPIVSFIILAVETLENPVIYRMAYRDFTAIYSFDGLPREMHKIGKSDVLVNEGGVEC
jgi:hypothetical protein